MLKSRSVDAVKRELVDLINTGIDEDRAGPLTLFTPDGKAFRVEVATVKLVREKEFDYPPDEERERKSDYPPLDEDEE